MDLPSIELTIARFIDSNRTIIFPVLLVIEVFYFTNVVTLLIALIIPTKTTTEFYRFMVNKITYRDLLVMSITSTILIYSFSLVQYSLIAQLFGLFNGIIFLALATMGYFSRPTLQRNFVPDYLRLFKIFFFFTIAFAYVNTTSTLSRAIKHDRDIVFELFTIGTALALIYINFSGGFKCLISGPEKKRAIPGRTGIPQPVKQD